VTGQAPAYLGRVLDDGEPVGTCFQIAPGVLVTAWHVLDEIGAAAPGAAVEVDALDGDPGQDRLAASVARLDPVHDLAVLTCREGLPAVSGQLVPGAVKLHTAVTVTGHCVIEDRAALRWLTAVGEWAGTAMRDDAVVVGRINADAVLPGMSGAPVVRESDGAVTGVVSGRYNSADHWLAGSVWVARTEDLAPLLDGIAGAAAAFMREAPSAPVDVLLVVGADKVRLTGLGMDVEARHGGVRTALADAVAETRRARSLAGLPTRDPAGAVAVARELSMSRAGRLLAESFLPEPVAAGLAKALEAAGRAHQPVRLGLAIPADLTGLPWESLPGPTGTPLALHPLVSLYRKTDTSAREMLPGPLRIVVAIAAPDQGGGAVLDYERELRNVLAAVRSARQDAADVRVVPFATTAAIRAELDRGPAHVLHVTGHGSPGALILEDEEGAARKVTADQFADQAIPPGKMPPVITLSACYTDVIDEAGGTSFAGRLCQRGAAAVIATETSVTDTYATRLLARVYGALASAAEPDVVAALSTARRDVQGELEASADRRDAALARLGEWAAVTILAGSGSVPVLDAAATAAAVARPSRQRIAGLEGRDDWYFVGRRTEQRRWPAELTGEGLAGIVIYGIGGTGKTTLAAEVIARLLAQQADRILVSLAGPLTLEGTIGAVISAVRRELLVGAHRGDQVMRALDAAARADLGWADRLAILRSKVLDQVPVLVVLDNFEDNLRPAEHARHVMSDEPLAGLLAQWVADPGSSRLLITCRYPFTLPDGAERFLSFRQLGALSRAETMKLAWSLPALDTLDEEQLDRVWRLAGGHPRSLEYLDALLSAGKARYPDVTRRMDAAISRRLSGSDRGRWLAARSGLDSALAETIALAADDVLLDDLLGQLADIDGATELLLGTSVYREPVDQNAILFLAGAPDPEAEYIPDRRAARERITQILAEAGIAIDESLDLDSVPADVAISLAPHLAEVKRLPEPPYRPTAEISGQLIACQAASLLTISGSGQGMRFFVHRWTATELGRRAAADHTAELDRAHAQAASYWLWRYSVWPQDKTADLHDLLEARHHLLQAGDVEQAGSVTESICIQLDIWGAWDQEASLIYDTLARLPVDSNRRAAWIHQLGIIAQSRGEYDEATGHYQRSLNIKEQIGDQAGVSSSYHQLGNVAYLRGDYDEATGHYQRSLDIKEQIGDEAGKAATYHQLGIIAQDRGDYEEAGRRYQRALDIKEQIGDRASAATTYGQLGILAQTRGDDDEAARQYQRALDIFDELGDQAGLSRTYHQLGILAQRRSDYDEAARQYQRSLDIKERLGDQAGLARTYHQLGILAQSRSDYDEAARQYHRSLDIKERLGDQAGLASSYGQLGNLAYDRGNRDDAARQYQRALDIFERLGDPVGTSGIYHQLGMLAHAGGDYDEAAHDYQRSLDIKVRIGDQVGAANTHSQLGFLETDRGGTITAAIGRHVRALTIRLRFGDPKAMIDLRQLAAHRRDLGTEEFGRLLAGATGDAEAAEAVTGLLDRLEAVDDQDA
jgi:tetratricopeptide (TPR) repeat protein